MFVPSILSIPDDSCVEHRKDCPKKDSEETSAGRYLYIQGNPIYCMSQAPHRPIPGYRIGRHLQPPNPRPPHLRTNKNPALRNPPKPVRRSGHRWKPKRPTRSHRVPPSTQKPVCLLPAVSRRIRRLAWITVALEKIRQFFTPSRAPALCRQRLVLQKI